MVSKKRQAAIKAAAKQLVEQQVPAAMAYTDEALAVAKDTIERGRRYAHCDLLDGYLEKNEEPLFIIAVIEAAAELTAGAYSSNNAYRRAIASSFASRAAEQARVEKAVAASLV